MVKKTVYIIFILVLLFVNVFVNIWNIIYFSAIAMLATAITIVGLLCCVFHIKKLFKFFYVKMLPTVEKSEIGVIYGVVSEKKAYRNLKVTTIIVLSVSLVFHILIFFF